MWLLRRPASHPRAVFPTGSRRERYADPGRRGLRLRHSRTVASSSAVRTEYPAYFYVRSPAHLSGQRRLRGCVDQREILRSRRSTAPSGLPFAPVTRTSPVPGGKSTRIAPPSAPPINCAWSASIAPAPSQRLACGHQLPTQQMHAAAERPGLLSSLGALWAREGRLDGPNVGVDLPTLYPSGQSTREWLRRSFADSPLRSRCDQLAAPVLSAVIAIALRSRPVFPVRLVIRDSSALRLSLRILTVDDQVCDTCRFADGRVMLRML